MMTDEVFGTNVAKLRGGRTQAWVAQRMKARGHKWAQGTVSAVERGVQPLRFREAVDLAAVLAPTLPLGDALTLIVDGSPLEREPGCPECGHWVIGVAYEYPPVKKWTDDISDLPPLREILHPCGHEVKPSGAAESARALAIANIRDL